VPGRGKAKRAITPNFNDAAGWGLWRLSLILREISGDQKGITGKDSAPVASEQAAPEVSSGESSRNE
jgi:hypothetical protein